MGGGEERARQGLFYVLEYLVKAGGNYVKILTRTKHEDRAGRAITLG